MTKCLQSVAFNDTFSYTLCLYLSGYSVTVLIDLENLNDDWESLIKKIGLLKRHCFASVFEKYFDFQEYYFDSHETGIKMHKRAVIEYRDQEYM